MGILKQSREAMTRPVGETHTGLRRAVGPWGSYTWGYADVGADIYVALGLVIATAEGLANVAFLFAGLVYVCVGLAYTELSAMYPLAGGGQLFVLRGLGDFWGFVAGWAVLLDFTIDIALFAYSSAGYADHFLPQLSQPPWIIIEAIGLVLFLLALNIVGVRESSRLHEVAAAIDIVTETLRIERTLDADGVSIEQNDAGVGLGGACQDAGERALARAIFTDERVNFARTEIEGDVLESGDSAVVFADALGFEQKIHSIATVSQRTQHSPNVHEATAAPSGGF